MKNKPKKDNKVSEHAMHLFGGLIITTMVISFFGFLYDVAHKLSDVFGVIGFIVILLTSYFLGWLFFRKLDKRIKDNANPHIIHYSFEDLKNKKDI